MALSEAGHLYKPGEIGSHLLRSKCNSVFAIAACWAGGGSGDEHPPTANTLALQSLKTSASPFVPPYLLSFELPLHYLLSVLIRFARDVRRVPPTESGPELRC